MVIWRDIACLSNPSLGPQDYSGGHLATQPVHVPSPLSAYWTAVPLWSSGDTSCSNPTRLSVLPWTAMVVIRQHIVFGSSPSLCPLDCSAVAITNWRHHARISRAVYRLAFSESRMKIHYVYITHELCESQGGRP